MCVGFAKDIKNLFREKDRDSMLSARGFDLWDHEDVSAWADRILAEVESANMPCDAAWPAENVALFKKWIEDGKQP